MEDARLIPIENGWGHPFEELNYYKVYNDGGHYVGTRLKTGEKIVYSRGIPAEICVELPASDIAGTFIDFVTKYVLFDDVIDWERDIKDYAKKKRIELERRYL